MMHPSANQREQAEFTRLTRAKSKAPVPMDAMGPELIAFFKNGVQKRQGKFAKIADAWNQLIPPTLLPHCCLDSFTRGALVVLVDTSSHLYEMKQLLLSGLQQQLLLACKSAGLKKISLKPGRWYDGEGQSDPKLRF